MDITIRQSGATYIADWGAGARRCAVGRSGIGEKCREGDGLTPAGRWPLRRLFYRADRLGAPKSPLPVKQIVPDDAWCDIPADDNYNRLVRLPYATVNERLWREDHVYDLMAVVGFNDSPVIQGRGSAIFVHLARDDFSPTEGCVALALDDLLAALAQFSPHDRLIVAP
jgi:L,D-peptidoglycan transpeptidase YkuD (ErfK/YbiS/YcfS/YnhG family)